MSFSGYNPHCRVIGTSYKSTKLVHGGVRYLQKAELDHDQYCSLMFTDFFVFEAVSILPFFGITSFLRCHFNPCSRDKCECFHFSSFSVSLLRAFAKSTKAGPSELSPQLIPIPRCLRTLRGVVARPCPTINPLTL